MPPSIQDHQPQPQLQQDERACCVTKALRGGVTAKSPALEIFTAFSTSAVKTT